MTSRPSRRCSAESGCVLAPTATSESRASSYRNASTLSASSACVSASVACVSALSRSARGNGEQLLERAQEAVAVGAVARDDGLARAGDDGAPAAQPARDAGSSRIVATSAGRARYRTIARRAGNVFRRRARAARAGSRRSRRAGAPALIRPADGGRRGALLRWPSREPAWRSHECARDPLLDRRRRQAARRRRRGRRLCRGQPRQARPARAHERGRRHRLLLAAQTRPTARRCRRSRRSAASTARRSSSRRDAHQPLPPPGRAGCRVRCTPIRPLLPTLDFIRNKSHWGAAFRFGYVRVPPEDFARIAAALTDAPAGTPRGRPAGADAGPVRHERGDRHAPARPPGDAGRAAPRSAAAHAEDIARQVRALEAQHAATRRVVRWFGAFILAFGAIAAFAVARPALVWLLSG